MIKYGHASSWFALLPTASQCPTQPNRKWKYGPFTKGIGLLPPSAPAFSARTFVKTQDKKRECFNLPQLRSASQCTPDLLLGTWKSRSLHSPQGDCVVCLYPWCVPRVTATFAEAVWDWKLNMAQTVVFYQPCSTRH